MKTPDIILQKSLDLFNEHGVSPISTNHIAAELKISPGNLYYHFKNKEEIIRVLFQQLLDANAALWQIDAAGQVKSPIEYIDGYQNIYWKYRFFFRELSPILRKDPELAKMWRGGLKQVMGLIRAGYTNWVTQGFVKEISDPHELEILAETVLIVSTSFLSYFETKQTSSTKKKLRTSLPHLANILKPYCQPKLQAELIGFIAQFANASEHKDSQENSAE